ncbi:MAG TPA: GNAT family N-acetyltransferase [Acetivibrio sp.]|nr:GNAT family N-acetyltransferase [Clostridium sp.]HOQ36080.1 GNAT family N-acetyltransferase [Acetivibrio sp.]HPT90142.1 GNAT family N-acetyltransferase [Acetivibrio sp.]
MDIKILSITDPEEKSGYAEKILRRLPEWFGNEEGLKDYIKGVRELPFFAAMDSNEGCVGFFSVKQHYSHTGDIYVCGVLPEYQNKGIGKKLFSFAENYMKQNGCKYIIVKTLSEIANYEPYLRTQLFYKSVGFEPLITLNEMWDEENPCLIMIKII